MKEEDPFDRLLQQGARPPDNGAPPAGCLDAETLAAWVEGTLTGVDRATAEAHAADCDRCLAMLAAMARTEPPPQVEARRPSWFSLRWMAPVAAAAVVIIAWVIVQNPREHTDKVATPPAAVDAITPVAPAAPADRPRTEGDAAAQTRTGAAKVEQKQAPIARSKSQPAAEAARRDEAQEKRERQGSPQGRIGSGANQNAVPPGPRRADESLLRAARTPTVIVSREPGILWRVTGSIVERSIDRGVTWTRQLTGSNAILVTGSSPAATVCWVVGQAGTVLLTTDGETWRRLGFPDPKADLIAITARDGSSATVTTADGRSYRTEDGGKTWRVQESSAAAF